ncbi:MAG: response regulator [Bacteroidetes bacterium]|nr:response regulator [Bacteroidota bacterium]
MKAKRCGSILITCLIWAFIPIFGKSLSIPFSKLNTSNGLGSNTINDLVKDQQGFIWIATTDGLSRYDGTNVLTIISETADSNSLASNQILSIDFISPQVLMILHSNGIIQSYNLAENNFKTLLLKAPSAKQIRCSNNSIILITENEAYIYDQDGNQEKALLNASETRGINGFKMLDNRLCILSTNNGLFLLRNKTFQPISKTHAIRFKDVIESDNDMYALSEQGVLKLDKNLTLSPSNYQGGADWAKFIYGENGQFILVGKDAISAFIGDSATQYSLTDFGNSPLFYGNVNTTLKTKDGLFWIGTKNDGLLLLYPNSIFSSFKPFADYSFSKQAEIGFTDKDGNNLIATANQIELYNDRTKLWILQFPKEETITTITQDDQFYLAGTSTGTIYYITENGQISHSIKINNQLIHCIKPFKTELLIGSSNGLYTYNVVSQTSSKAKSKNLEWTSINDIEIYNNQILLATTKGLYLWNGTDSESNIYNYEELKTECKNIYVLNGNIWITTNHKGAFLINNQLEKAAVNQVLNKANTLDDNQIVGIVTDPDANTWLCTRTSLYRYDKSTKNLFAYRANHGITVGEITGIYNTSKKILITGKLGAITFNPQKIDKSQKPVPLNLTGIIKGGRTLNSANVAYTKDLRVGYNDNFFTLSFAALDFQSTKHVQYFYRIPTVHNDWVNIGNANEATFPNPSPGNYTLQIKALDSRLQPAIGQIELNLKVIPPFYATWWFRITIIALVLFIGVSIYLVNIKQERRRNKRLEYEVDKRTFILKQQNVELEEAKEMALESSKAKSEFMATMSHEIRTPMNGLLGTLDLMKHTELNIAQKDYVNTIAECGENMLAIINEILDYSKIESGRLQPELHAFDLIHVVENAADLYDSRAVKKGLDFSFYVDRRLPAKIISDQTRITQVLNNLVNNAIKFTTQGYVHVEVLYKPISTTECELLLKVMDTGIGIHADKLERIFEAFTQADSSTTREFGGTGLGLAICKSIVKALGGKIWVESELGKGSTFNVSIKAQTENNKPHVAIPNVDLGDTPKLLFVTSNSYKTFAIDRLASEIGSNTEVCSSSQINSISGSYHLAFYDGNEAKNPAERDKHLKRLEDVCAKVVYIPKKGEEPIDGYASISRPVRRSAFYKLISEEKLSDKTVLTKPAETKITTTTVGEEVKILLAEDNRVNQMVTSKIFKAMNLSLDIANNGKEAVEMQKKNEYDIILMDILMPEMDGKQATIAIRQDFANKNAPAIIAFSANIFNEEKEEFNKLGFTDTLSKPAKIDDIKRLLERYAHANEV